MDYDRIKTLIKLVEDSEISGLKVEEDNIKIEIQKTNETAVVSVPAAAPAAVSAAAPVAQAAPKEEASSADDADPNLIPVTSPMVGTFYSSPNPDSPPYVKVGDSVSSGSVVCIIEAMKLFNEIEAEKSGVIEKICVESGSPVEYGQTLFLIRAS